MAEKGLTRAREVIFSDKYDIIVLDEVITAHYFHLVSLEQILEIVAHKPDGVELVFTGRYTPLELTAAADLVTECKCIGFNSLNTSLKEGLCLSTKSSIGSATPNNLQTAPFASFITGSISTILSGIGMYPVIKCIRLGKF